MAGRVCDSRQHSDVCHDAGVRILFATTAGAGHLDALHAEMDRARKEFRDLAHRGTPADFARRSSGTRWTNRELLFHMLFGYLVTRNLRIVVKIVARLPADAQGGFAALLNGATRPFHQINYWGSRAGGRLVSPARMTAWLDRVIASLHRHLDRESEAALQASMAFPTSWDPYFAKRMSLADVYHYPTVHFDHHRRQLTLDE
jgi:hypothetical protein